MSQKSTSQASRIAFIHSCWHLDIVVRGRDTFIEHIEKFGVRREDIDIFAVPGAFEIPLHAKLLAQSNRYSAVVACGFVVDGGVYRHEFVAHAVIDGLMRVQLDTDVPVFSVVLTPQQFHEHDTHRAFFLEHMTVKGAEAAGACARTLDSLNKIRADAAHLRRTG
jgi:6,7-dimethyl-8-ribityllumazine synthase